MTTVHSFGAHNVNADNIDQIADLMAQYAETQDPELLRQAIAATKPPEPEMTPEQKAVRATHDAGEWMDWQAGKAMVLDGGDYEAEMVDGLTIAVVAEVYDVEAVSLIGDDGEPVEDHTIRRVRRV